MMKIVIALLIGALFGAGLVVSGMSNPGNVLNFLDVAGTWDARLMFVMGGAVVMTSIGFAALMRRARPLLAEKFTWPTATMIDKKLLVGAALFGIGWGLAGYCPGPALASIGAGAKDMLFFIPALVAGMWAATKIR
jgi:uncharacterized protein